MILLQIRHLMNRPVLDYANSFTFFYKIETVSKLQIKLRLAIPEPKITQQNLHYDNS